jgi:hypothetical protein
MWGRPPGCQKLQQSGGLAHVTPPIRRTIGGARSASRRKERDLKLDSFKWLKEESLENADDLPEPEELAAEAISELEGAVEELNAVLALLGSGNGQEGRTSALCDRSIPYPAPMHGYHMSIRARVEDAMIAFAIGRPEGALVSILTAISATSRRRRPLGTPSVVNPSQAMGDREAFELFVSEQMPIICRVKDFNIHFRGEMHKLEHVLYKWLRCEMSHGAALPFDITFEPDLRPGLTSIGTGKEGLRFSHSFLDGLADAVIQAPENADHFGDPPRSPVPIHLLKVGLTIGASK